MKYSLFVLNLASVGSGYKVLQFFSTLNDPLDAEFLELIPRPKGCLVLVRSLDSCAEELKAKVSTLLEFNLNEKIEVVENWSIDLEKTFYSLESNSVKSDLLIVESDSLYEILIAAVKAQSCGAVLLDLKADRTGIGEARLYLDIDFQNNLHRKFFDEISINNLLKKTLIKSPCEEVKGYFS